jgi:ankyrin repeat protein
VPTSTSPPSTAGRRCSRRVNNRNYRLALLLIERGADVNRPNKGGWSPLYLAVDNRNIEGGDYPVPKPDLDHLDVIKALLAKGANPNAKVKDNTLTRTIFTMQWFFEDGATPFIRASQSSDVTLMKLLLEKGADPKAVTAKGDSRSPRPPASAGWTASPTSGRRREPRGREAAARPRRRSQPRQQRGADALMGAALKGRPDVIRLLVERGAKLETRDRGSRDTTFPARRFAGVTFQAVDYAEGLVRVGVQSAVERPEASAVIRKLMEDEGCRASQGAHAQLHLRRPLLSVR